METKFPSERARRAAYERHARERQEALKQEELERLAKIEYVARLGTGRVTLKAKTFSELGDLLSGEGYQMHKTRNSRGVFKVPYKNSSRDPAILEVRGG